jgi:hypothetical protein
MGRFLVGAIAVSIENEARDILYVNHTFKTLWNSGTLDITMFFKTYHPWDIRLNRFGSDSLPITKEVENKKKGRKQTIHTRVSLLFVKVDATNPKHIAALHQMGKFLVEQINNSDIIMDSYYPKKNKVHFLPEKFIQEVAAFPNQLVGHTSALRMLRKMHPDVTVDANFGRNHQDIMADFFAPESLNEKQVRELGAHWNYAKPDIFDSLKQQAAVVGQD